LAQGLRFSGYQSGVGGGDMSLIHVKTFGLRR